MRAGLLHKLLGILCRQACSSPRGQSFQSLRSICTCGHVFCTLDYNPVLLYLLLSCTSCGRWGLFHWILLSLSLAPVSVLHFAALFFFSGTARCSRLILGFSCPIPEPAISPGALVPFSGQQCSKWTPGCWAWTSLFGLCSSGLHTRPAFTFSHHMPHLLLVPVCSFYKTAQIWFLELSGF